MKLAGDLNLVGGELQNVRAENLPALPAFQAGDEGRFIYVTTGLDVGFWFGATDGTASYQRLSLGTALVDYDLTDQPIADATTFQGTLSAAGTAAEKGQVMKIEVSSTLSSGQVLIELYEDIGRSDSSKFYEAYYDLANPNLMDRVPTYFEADNSAGDIYIDVTNLTGAAGEFTVSLTAGGVVVVQTPPPPGSGSGINAGVAGDGISFDAINARLDVILGVDSGLELVGAAGSRVLRVDVAAGGGLERVVGGLQTDSTVVRTTGDQSISGIKTLADSILLIAPAGTTGPPSAGTHTRGEVYVDDDLDEWLCVTGGIPGTWIFKGRKRSLAGGDLSGTSYTGTVTAGSSAVLEIPVTARRGVINKLNIWAKDPADSNVSFDQPFRVICYPNENQEGREQLWEVIGRARGTFVTSGVVAGNQTIDIDTVGSVNLNDLVRFRALAGIDEEYQRVTVRRTAPVQIDVDETLVNNLALNDLALFVEEAIDLFWENTSGIPAESQKIFLEFTNDDAGGIDLVFGYDLIIEEIGGGAPV